MVYNLDMQELCYKAIRIRDTISLLHYFHNWLINKYKQFQFLIHKMKIVWADNISARKSLDQEVSEKYGHASMSLPNQNMHHKIKWDRESFNSVKVMKNLC